MDESSSERPLKQNTIETDIPMDNAESCRRKYNSLKEAQKLHKLNDINYRLEILSLFLQRREMLFYIRFRVHDLKWVLSACKYCLPLKLHLRRYMKRMYIYLYIRKYKYLQQRARRQYARRE